MCLNQKVYCICRLELWFSYIYKYIKKNILLGNKPRTATQLTNQPYPNAIEKIVFLDERTTLRGCRTTNAWAYICSPP